MKKAKPVRLASTGVRVKTVLKVFSSGSSRLVTRAQMKNRQVT
jgi:hypothetical protein